MQGVVLGRLKIQPVEERSVVTDIVNSGELRRIEITTAAQAGSRDELSPVLATDSKVEVRSAGSERTVGSADAAGRLLAKPRFRRHTHHHAVLVAKFSRWNAGDDFHGLNCLRRYLIGIGTTLLVGDWLTIDCKLRLRVIALRMEEAV